MLTTILLDLDETLCDTTKANNLALIKLEQKFTELFNPQDAKQSHLFANAYLKGIYRELSQDYQQQLCPIVDEASFRLTLIKLILRDLGLRNYAKGTESILQSCFDEFRRQYFDFFPYLEAWLAAMREQFTLGVITNGPVFSQQEKVNKVRLTEKVDFVIIGGEEPEQKPAKSIFDKALSLANCAPENAIHIGDSLSADIQGANNASIASIWISHGQIFPTDSLVTPNYIITSPLNIPAIITEITEFKK